MKTKLTLLLMLLLTTAWEARAEKVGYTVLSEDGKTLTYYYDDAKAEKVGTIKELGYHDNAITKVIFDESFAEARPTSTSNWFVSMPSLQEFVGMENLNTSNVTDMRGMFSYCSSLTSLDLSHFDTSNVTDMRGMFYRCLNLETIDLTNFNTSKVKTMGGKYGNDGMFSSCNSLKSLDLSHFDTSNVTDMSCMFVDCSNLTSLDLSHFDTSNVTSMASMFNACKSLTSLDVSHFNTSNVTAMDMMFCSCENLTGIDLSHFDTSKVTDMSEMFLFCNSLTSLDLSNFDTSNVTSMYWMFCSCENLASLDVSHFDTSSVTNMAMMFAGCQSLTSLDVSHFDTRNVTDMGAMFSNCSSLTSLDLSHFDTGNVTKISSMFNNCRNLKILDLSHFDTGNVTAMGGMFYNCSRLITIYAGEGWSVGENCGTKDMFGRVTNLVGGLGTVYDSNNVDGARAHIDGGSENPGYFTDIALKYAVRPYVVAEIVDNVPTATYYYDDQHSMRDASVVFLFGNWRISIRPQTRQMIQKVEFDESFAQARPVSTNSWFSGMTGLHEIVGMEYLNTSDVTDMGGMFYRCNSLTSLDASNFDMSKVENTLNMFRDCSSLETLCVSTSMSDLSEDACTGVGTAEAPCLLVAPEGFDYGVDTTGDYFQWKSGYFKVSGSETPEKEGYTVLSEDGKTLTYYYDAAQADKVGTIKELGYNDWTITQVIFDESFAEARPTSTEFWFYGMTSLRDFVGMENLNTSNVTSMDYMFYNCDLLTSLDVSHFDTSNVTDMRLMFGICSKLTSLDVSHFDTSNVTDMSAMFSGCSSLTSLDVSHFDTSKVTFISGLFSNCYNLTSLDVSHFDTSNVTFMGNMFAGCQSLTSLDVSNFDMSKVEDAKNMFENCSSLETLSISSSMSGLSEDACTGVGTAEAPCLLVAPEGFDYGVDTTGDYFLWKSGYFKVENAGAPVIAELTLDENAENEIPEGGTVVQTVNTVRTLVGGVWNTFCLPFSVTSEEMADVNHPLHGAIIMTLTDVEYNDNAQMNLYFSPVVELTGGEPYVVKVPANVVNPTFHNVTITSQEPRISNVGPWQMAGIYSPYKFSQADSGIFFLTGGNKFSYVAEPGTMKGMRAYFVLKEDYDFANICINFDEATGITQLRVGESHQSEVYDLQGRKLNQTPAHGVYIINGKKYVK